MRTSQLPRISSVSTLHKDHIDQHGCQAYGLLAYIDMRVTDKTPISWT